MPTRGEFLAFHRPSIGEGEIAGAVEVLRSGWLTTGLKCREFEQAFARYVGSKYTVAVNSGTAALHLALAAVGVQPGDEVITSPFTFAATAEVVVYLGAVPVFADCHPETFNIDPARIVEKITQKTRAILPVHFGGLPCEMQPILEVARAHNLKVIEDAAHALPARALIPGAGYRMVGTIGDVTCFSFYATKNITTCEGGMVATDNEQYADLTRLLSLHGISHDAWKRYSADGRWYYEILHPGYKYNMTDIAAAIGLEQLKKCDQFQARRRQIAQRYVRGFSGLEEVLTPSEAEHGQHSWHLFVIRLNLDRLSIDRDQVIEELKNRNIGTSVHFIPLHLHPYYMRTYAYKRGDYPGAEAIYERCISLPIYPKMSDRDVDDVIEALTDIVGTYRR